MKVGFIHPKYPGAPGHGATIDATQIALGLNENSGKKSTIICLEKPPQKVNNEFESVIDLSVNSSIMGNPISILNRHILESEPKLRDFDVLHSYSSKLIPSLGQISSNHECSAVVTLNSFSSVCPRRDLLYRGEAACQGSSFLKCSFCLGDSALNLSRRESDSLSYHIGRVGYRFQKGLRKYRSLQHLNTHVCEIDRYQAVSKHIRESYIDQGYPNKKIFVAPNIHDPSFNINHTSSFDEPYNLLYVGSLTTRKGADRLPPLLEALRHRYNKQVILTVVGDGPLKPRLRNEFEDNGVANWVDMRGYVDNECLPDVYASHDALVYIGRCEEAFGRIFLEAMGAGTPIFSTNVGDVSNIIRNSGIITGGSDPKSIARDLSSFLSKKRLSDCSENASSNLDRFRRTSVISRLMREYENIVDR